MGSEGKCGKCGASVAAKAKFCPSCGAKVENIVGEPPVTLALLTEVLSDDGEELENGMFKLVLETLDERSQLVWALPLRNQGGDEDLDDIALWSPFAPVKSVNVKKVVEAIDPGSPFGFVKHGEYFALTTSIRPCQLKSIDAFVTLIQRLAFMADELEVTLLGTDSL